MKIVIHAGMHKTGTSSIQRTFSTLAEKQEVYTYAPVPAPEPSHNVLFILGFLDEHELEDYYLFKFQNLRLPQLRPIKKERLAALDAAIAANTRPVFLFSQEAMRGHFLSGVRRFADYCRSKTDDIEVLAYVRPPVSYAASMYQEVSKQFLNTRGVPLLQPAEYRLRFEALQEAFGSERVRFKLYHRAHLKGGDVVLDFAAEAGIPLQPGQVIQRNEGVGLETVALLHAFKSLLPPRRPAPYRLWQNDSFVARLAALGKTRLTYAPQLAAKVIDSQRTDIDWMEQRLGASLEEDLDADAHKPANGQPIGNPEDLLPIAEAQAEAVEALAAQVTGKSPPAGASPRARLLYALTALHEHDSRATYARPPTLYTGLR